MIGEIWRRLLALGQRRRLARELDEEIRGHYAELRQSLEEDGLPDAARQARLRFGGDDRIHEAAQDVWRFGRLESLLQDFQIALRALRRRPGFASAAIATLALGMGASTAIFSVVYNVALRPLPYATPDRLIRIYEANRTNGRLKEDVSAGAYLDWRSTPSIESAALISPPGARTVAAGGWRLATMRVSPGFLDVFGVRPILGPGFKPEPQYTRFTTDDVLLSYNTWQRVFAGRPDVVGQTLTFSGVGDDDRFTVVGVLPPGFTLLEPADVWMPEVLEAPAANRLRAWRYDRVVARMKPGVTMEQAKAELEAVAARSARDFPTSSAGWSVTVETLHASVVGEFGRATWLLLATVTVVLLVACLNVGGLLVARAVSRERETALRISLGASSSRLLQFWFAEACLLTAAGTLIGILLAGSGVSALKSVAPPGIPRLDAVALDWTTLVVSATCAVLAIVGFTVAPIHRFRSTRRRTGLAQDLRSGAGAGDRVSRHRTRAALTVVQCAGAATLVILAVILTRSFLNLMSFDLGWDSGHVLSLQGAPTFQRDLRRPWFARVEWSDRLIAGLEALPGVEHAAVSSQLPLGLASYGATLARGRGRQHSDSARWRGTEHRVTDGYFRLMGIRLVEGRLFNADDRFTEPQMTNSALRPESGIAVVTETTARTLWPDGSALDQAIWLPDSEVIKWQRVVGVVEDIQFGTVGEAPGLHVFIPFTQDSAGARLNVLIKTQSDPAGLASAARQQMLSVAPGAAVDQIVPLGDLVDRATAQPRFTSRLIAAFSVLALALAAVGIYGTLSYLVGTRTREIGIRLALGAPRGNILSRIVWRGFAPALAGGAIGLLAAMLLARTFRALLFGIEPIDVRSFLIGALVLMLVALAAAVGPARRASRVDPVRALRAD
jgi:predicted permease